MSYSHRMVSTLVTVLALSVAAPAVAAPPTTVEGSKLPLSFLATAGNPHTARVGPKGRVAPRATVRASQGVPGIDSLINFTGQFSAPGFDGNGNPQTVWPFSMVGRAPEAGGVTVINNPIIPVVVDLLDADGNVATFAGQPLTFDGRQFVQPVVRSPLYQPFLYNTGVTQFADAMMRNQFWDRIHRGDDGDNGYHVLLTPSVKTVRHMQIPLGSYFFIVDANNVPLAALVDFTVFIERLFPTTVPVDATTPVGAAELAGDMTTRDLTTLLLNNVLLFNGDTGSCCTLGFHTFDLEPGDASNGNRERRFVTNFASWVAPGLFTFGVEDIATLSHEISETFNDPFVDNATPWWSSTDPFFGASLCQNNLESGDVIEVLSSNQVFPIQMNGRTYHPQNEATFSWFSFTSPSLARNQSYSFPDETTLTRLSPANLLPGCVPSGG